MKILSLKTSRYIAAIVLLDGLLFSMTNPVNTSSFIVIIGFLCLTATTWLLFYGLLRLLGLYGIAVAHSRRLSLYLGTLLSGLIALQSIGELARRDVVVLVPLVGLVHLYSVYAKPRRRNFET